MLSFNFCGRSILCSVYFNNTNWDINLNNATNINTWGFDLVPGINEITLKEALIIKKGSMLQLSFAQFLNVYSHSHDILLDYEFDYPISSMSKDSIKIQPALGTFCVRALTRRYYFGVETNFNVQFAYNGTFSLLVYMFDQINSFFYVKNSYTINVNPPGN